MKIEIEYNSKVDNASQKYILDSILLSYLDWSYCKTLKNFAKIPTHLRGNCYVHKFFKCAWNIVSGHYKKLLRKYVNKITFNLENKDSEQI